MFSQVRSHQGHAGGGLGIGLSLVRQLIEIHGGSVTASSPGPNQGSTLSVRLPLEIPTDATVQVPAAVAPAPVAAATRRVLIVDDNEDAASSLAVLLQLGGHEVMTAYDGRDGVTRAESFQPHIVLLDLGMPNMDGFEAAARMRALPTGARMTLIALTGWGQEHDLERTRAAGFDHHFLKPIDIKALEQLLGRAH